MNSFKLNFRITLKSFDKNLINIASQILFDFHNQDNASYQIKGPIGLPTKIRKFCVLRSPHVDKDSREHFQIKVYKRFIDFYTNSSDVLVSYLEPLEFPAGVSMQLELKKNFQNSI